MRIAVYNSAIPSMLNSVTGAAFGFRSLLIACLALACVLALQATDWSVPEQQLARKIAAVTGPGAMAVSIENKSSLGHREFEIISNGLRGALESAGIRSATVDSSVANISISLSENPSSYVWVAEIRQGTGEPSVVLVSIARPEGATVTRDSVPLALKETLLWSQTGRILDVLVLEEKPNPTHIAVLSAENVSLYRVQDGKWKTEAALAVTHNRPWPRDLRGRLVPGTDHLLNAYLPGVVCRTSSTAPLTLDCRESDDPWPLTSSSANPATPNVPSALVGQARVPSVSGFFAANRNFFTGVLTPAVGKFSTAPKFYSAAVIPRDRYALWLFAGVDGQFHLVDGISDQTAEWNWGSDLASIHTTCGSGWQVLATNAGDQSTDGVRAYEFPDRDPVAVSSGIDFTGEITALWTEAKGDTAIAIAKSPGNDDYEAIRVAVACNQ